MKKRPIHITHEERQREGERKREREREKKRERGRDVMYNYEPM